MPLFAKMVKICNISNHHFGELATRVMAVLGRGQIVDWAGFEAALARHHFLYSPQGPASPKGSLQLRHLEE
jgi:hypothetical protein